MNAKWGVPRCALPLVPVALLMTACGGPQAAAPPSTAHNPLSGLLIGVHEDLGYDGDAAHRAQVVHAAASVLHAQVSRSSLLWSDVEAERGKWDWSRYDDIVNTVTTAGMTPLLVIVGSPAWANGVSALTPQHQFFVPGGNQFTQWVTDYSEFARLAAARYRGRVRWELWNEPNSAAFWKPQPDAADYAGWFTVVRSAIAESDPGAMVATGGLNHLVTAPIGEISGIDFLQSLEHASVSLDTIAIHPYTSPALGPLDHGAGGDNFDDIATVHDWVTRNAPHALLWITELGWDSGKVGEDRQAMYLKESLDLIRERYSYVPVAVVFLDYDRPAFTFGLLSSSLAPKRSAAIVADEVTSVSSPPAR